jgi:O-antigen/teichoic acid export membrane protein
MGTLFGAALTFVFYILGARVLGPENFGNLSLITAVSAILAISMGINVTPAVKYSSGARDEAVRTAIISTSYIAIVLFTAASVIIYALAFQWLSLIFGISSELFFFSVVYAVTLTFFTLTMSPLRILFRMRTFGLFNGIQSVIALSVFLVLISNNLRSWESAAFSIYISYIAITLVLVFYLRDQIKLEFDGFWAKKLITYSAFAAPGVIASAFLGVDRILINIFLTTADVGIYAAYYLPSITIALMLWGILNAAFFPYASKSSDRLSILRNINKAVPYLAAVLLPSIFLLELLAFAFYGRQYAFSWEIAFFFALAATTSVIFQAYLWLVASEGMMGAKVTTYSTILSLLVLIGLDVVLIPLIGISGAALTLIFAYLIPTLFLFSKRRILGGGQEQWQRSASIERPEVLK